MKDKVRLILLSIIAGTGIIIACLLIFKDGEAETEKQALEQNDYAELGQTAPNGELTKIHFDELIHDFGKIKQHTTNKFEFEFQNTGNNPLLISNAVGSCGCTVPDFPKDPIPVGKKAKIVVIYKPGAQEEYQEKIITVTANTDPPKTQLKIRAYLLK